MIQSLDFASPFYQCEYAEAEEALPVSGRGLICNLERLGGKPLYVEGYPVYPLGVARVRDAELRVPGKVLIIHANEQIDVRQEASADRIKSAWKSLWEYSHLERNRGIPYYKSPRAFVGGCIGMNFCLAEANTPSALHREHPEPFDEIHLQVAGSGAVQIFRENDPATLYQEYPLHPGNVNPPTWNEDGTYPWHRYESRERGIFVVIEIGRQEIH